MSNTNNLREINNKMSDNLNASLDRLDNLAVEEERISNVFNNTENIINELDREFSQKTGIYDIKDLSLLFVAIGMPCAKWIIMGQKLPLDFDFKYELTPNDKRLNAEEGDKLAKKSLRLRETKSLIKLNPKKTKAKSSQEQ